MLNSKKLLAAAAAGFMTLNTVAVPTFAATVPADGIDITKTVDKDSNVNYPAGATFEFEVVPGAAANVPGTNNTTIKGMAGEPGGLTATGTAAYNSKTNKYEGAKLVVNEDVFTEPGLYIYTVTEKPYDDEGANEGIIRDTKTYTAYVTVENDGYKADGTTLKFKVSDVQFADSDNLSVKSDDISFVNTYKHSGTDQQGLHKLTVTKTVTGNQGNKEGTFNFNVKVEGTEGETYQLYVNEVKYPTDLTSGAEVTIPVKVNDGEANFVIYGLSKSDSFTVTEADYSSDGYNTTYTGAANEGGQKVEIGTSDKALTVNNDKAGSVPTGIIMSAAPFAGMIGLGGIFAGLFFRKKRED